MTVTDKPIKFYIIAVFPAPFHILFYISVFHERTSVSIDDCCFD